jgi:hypothetical protein
MRAVDVTRVMRNLQSDVVVLTRIHMLCFDVKCRS